MAKVRKMLCSLDTPYITNIMRLMETQSKVTLGKWGLSYTEQNILPVYEECFGGERPRAALVAARDWFAGNVKLPEVKDRIYDCHTSSSRSKRRSGFRYAPRCNGVSEATCQTIR
jgi:hypothetical protein